MQTLIHVNLVKSKNIRLVQFQYLSLVQQLKCSENHLDQGKDLRLGQVQYYCLHQHKIIRS